MTDNNSQLEKESNFFSLINDRRTVREFSDKPVDDDLIDKIILDGCQAPSSCNHQMWHFVVIRDLKKREIIQKISGSNLHFTTCSVMIILCFHKGWNHNKFAVVQSVAASADHMLLSARARGLDAAWNAGLGSTDKIAKLIDLPPVFEIMGALCFGWPGSKIDFKKPPRRPLSSIRSLEKFERPADEIYPLKQSSRYNYEDLKDGRHRYSVFSPVKWGWGKIKNFRSYAVYAKSPLAGTYISRRFGIEMDKEIEMITPFLKNTDKLLEVLPYGGSYTIKLLQKFSKTNPLYIAELSQNNIEFIKERIKVCGYNENSVNASLLVDGLLPYEDNFFNVIFLPQIIETVPNQVEFLKEIKRVLKPGGVVIISARNFFSWFGLYFLKIVRRSQVPNFGPYWPVSPFSLRKKISGLFTIKKEVGLSVSPNLIGREVGSVLGYFSKLYVVISEKKYEN